MITREVTRRLFSTLALSAIAVACANGALARPITIAVAMKSQVERRWQFEVAAMQAAADKAGVKLIVQYANNDPALQATQVENMMSQQPDALIIAPVNSKSAGRIVKDVQAQGVPVVSHAFGITDAKPEFTQIRDSVSVGVLQAKGALDFAPKGTFAIINGDAGNDVAQDIGKGYKQTLGENKDIKIVLDQFVRGWDGKIAMSNAENVLSAQNDKVDGFIVASDGMSAGVAQAVQARGLAGKVYISGLDAEPLNLKLVSQGTQTMTVWTDIVGGAEASFGAALALAKKEQIPYETKPYNHGAGEVPTYFVSSYAVTKDDVCDFILNKSPKGWVSVADVFPDQPNACK